MKYILTTIAGVESIAKKEIEKIGGKILEVRDKRIIFEGDESVMVKINLWSRVGNKVYLVLAEEENIDNFDKLYDLVHSIDFKKYFKKNFPLKIKAKSIKSGLESTPAIQKITKKAIVDKLTDKSGERLPEDEDLDKFRIMVLIMENKAYILLNTSGEALHKRGYRIKTGDAPIKENLAAALVLLSGWKFSEPFYDMFCGSGTIVIEAAMIAKNIAPGLDRYFAFENLGLVDEDIVEKEYKKAEEMQYDSEYEIHASDIDDKILDIARKNACEAGVGFMINYETKDFIDYIEQGIKGTLVSNPPYGERLKDPKIESMYKQIDKLFRLNPELKGGVITSYLDFDNLIKKDDYKKRKLYNGGDKTYFYRRK